jgi:hypothetical protein
MTLVYHHHKINQQLIEKYYLNYIKSTANKKINIENVLQGLSYCLKIFIFMNISFFNSTADIVSSDHIIYSVLNILFAFRCYYV